MNGLKTEFELTSVGIHPQIINFLEDDNTQSEVETRLRDYMSASLRFKIPANEAVSGLIKQASEPDSEILLIGTRRPFFLALTHHWSSTPVVTFVEAMENIVKFGVYSPEVRNTGELPQSHKLISAIPASEDEAGILMVYKKPFSKRAGKIRWLRSLQSVVVLTHPATDPDTLTQVNKYLRSL